MRVMADPWLHILGLGEDGLDGLPAASRDLLDAAEIIIGGPRHLALAQAGSRGVAWPVPFSTAPVLAARGRRTVVLASGDPFWHGAGGSLIRDLAPGEWVSHPTPSSFQLACNRLGWRMEEVLSSAFTPRPAPGCDRC
jgi:precorrin-6Y C5,15-methyltransferase (decarboxylating)